MWDLGGQTSIRPYWRCYYPNTQAIIYVVDSSDVDRIGTSQQARRSGARRLPAAAATQSACEPRANVKPAQKLAENPRNPRNPRRSSTPSWRRRSSKTRWRAPPTGKPNGETKLAALPAFSAHARAPLRPQVLVFANKQDLPGALSEAQVSEGLGLHQIKTRQWSIFKTSAIKGEGLWEGMDWLSNTLKSRR